MPSAYAVACRLVHLAGHGEEPDYLTPSRLHKLLYYAQSWALATFGRPLFEERITASPRGPIVNDLSLHFAAYGCNVIPSDQLPDPEAFSAEEAAFVAAVWERYKGYSNSALLEMTRREAPWKAARRDTGDEEISHASLKAWFGPQLARQTVPGLPVARAYQAAAELDAAPGKTHAEVFADLRIGQCARN
jgi:uncharacterized phage-associated protein